jgi:hypothetical protein
LGIDGLGRSRQNVMAYSSRKIKGHFIQKTATI